MENASILEEKTSIVVNKYIPRLMDGFLVAPEEWMSAVRGFSPLSHSLNFRSMGPKNHDFKGARDVFNLKK